MSKIRRKLNKYNTSHANFVSMQVILNIMGNSPVMSVKSITSLPNDDITFSDDDIQYSLDYLFMKGTEELKEFCASKTL